MDVIAYKAIELITFEKIHVVSGIMRWVCRLHPERRLLIVVVCRIIVRRYYSVALCENYRRSDRVENVILDQIIRTREQFDAIALLSGVLRAVKVTVSNHDPCRLIYPNVIAVSSNRSNIS